MMSKSQAALPAGSRKIYHVHTYCNNLGFCVTKNTSFFKKKIYNV